jgi:hypothetical protein
VFDRDKNALHPADWKAQVDALADALSELFGDQAVAVARRQVEEAEEPALGTWRAILETLIARSVLH